MNYYEHHLGDYARDTGHLSQSEHGAYRLLLDHYYSTEAGIPESIVYAVSRARSKSERAATDAVLSQFFTLTNGRWTKGKCEEVIGAFKAKSDKARISAAKRWHSEGNANASKTHSEGNALQSPVTSNQKPEEKRERPAPSKTPDDFIVDEAWEPPSFVVQRLTLAGRSPTWTPANVQAFVAHYRGVGIWRNDKEWGEKFVGWMLRENAYSRGNKPSTDTMRENAVEAVRLIVGGQQ